MEKKKNKGGAGTPDAGTPAETARANRLRDQYLDQGGSVHLGRTGKDGVITDHEKTPREMREMGDDLRQSDDYMDPADENDLEEDHTAEDEE